MIVCCALAMRNDDPKMQTVVDGESRLFATRSLACLSTLTEKTSNVAGICIAACERSRFRVLARLMSKSAHSMRPTRMPPLTASKKPNAAGALSATTHAANCSTRPECANWRTGSFVSFGIIKIGKKSSFKCCSTQTNKTPSKPNPTIAYKPANICKCRRQQASARARAKADATSLINVQ